MVLSTPNVANISNVLALIKGDNIFWDPEISMGAWIVTTENIRLARW